MSTSDTELIQRCRERLRAVLAGNMSSLAAVHSAMETLRGRRIQLVYGDTAGLALPSGIWLQLRDRDVIWIDERTSEMMRLVNTGHELGHMVCGHVPTPLSDEVEEISQPIRTLADQHLGLSSSNFAAIGRCGIARSSPAVLDDRELLIEREAEITGRLLAQHLLARGGFAAALAEL